MSIIENTVWGKSAIPAAEWQFRGIRRIVVPLLGLLFIGGGIGAWSVGVPAIDKFYPTSVVELGAMGLGIAGVFTIIGVVFPRMWPLELGGLILALGLESAYALALLILTFTNHSERAFSGDVTIIAILLIALRLSLIGYEIQGRRTAAENARKARAGL